MSDFLKDFEKINQKLKFTANAIVEGFISGLHQSPYHGFSVEFSEHKAYSEGDSISLIDWKLYSKTDKYFVKRYEDETNVRAYFLLDCSHSMNFISNNVSKIDYAKLLTACLINLSLRQRDATGLALFNDKIFESIPAKSKSTWLNQCLLTLQNIKCSGQTNISETIISFCKQIKKRSLIVIITDFLDDTDALLKALNYLKFDKHHCILFHIIDEEEKNFNYKNETDFVDMESGEIMNISPWLIKKEYMKKFEMFRVKHKEMVEKQNFEYCQICTSTPIKDNLKLFLQNRRKK